MPVTKRTITQVTNDCITIVHNPTRKPDVQVITNSVGVMELTLTQLEALAKACTELKESLNED